MFRNPLEEQGGEGLFAPCALRLSQKKALSVHYVPTTSARTPVAHREQKRIARPLWGAPPRGPKTWVMEVVEMKEVKKGGPIGGPKEDGNATSPLHSRGSSNKGGQNQSIKRQKGTEKQIFP